MRGTRRARGAPLPASALRVQLGRAQRFAEQRIDQGLVLSGWSITRRLPGRAGPPQTAPLDGRARIALLTVNFSTTRHLRLMLASLADQERLGRLTDIVICDNGSRDDPEPLYAALTTAVPRIQVVRNRHLLSHARGVRSALRTLAATGWPTGHSPNVVLFCDTDVLFRDPGALDSLARVFEETPAAFAGELRHHLHPLPEAQASFLAVRRDWLASRTTVPWVNHGSPAYWLQCSIWQAGGQGVDFPSNGAGYILHRGRSGVAAAGEYRRWHSYGSARTSEPHFMGIAEGPEIWRAAEQRYAHLTAPGNEPALAAALARAWPQG